MPYYAVRRGRKAGVYNTWDECQKNVSGHPGAQYAKFTLAAEASAYMNGCGNKSDAIREASGNDIRNTTIAVGSKCTNNAVYNDISHNRASADPSPVYCHDVTASQSTTTERLVVYTDGACLDNGRSNPRGGYGVYAPNDPSITSYGPIHDNHRITNQRAELTAIREALSRAPSDAPLEIRTDSRYAQSAITQWSDQWEMQDWNVEKKNLDLIRDIKAMVRKRAGPVYFEHVRGHSGEPGNEMADCLANKGATMY